jgi:hypothetical protein
MKEATGEGNGTDKDGTTTIKVFQVSTLPLYAPVYAALKKGQSKPTEENWPPGYPLSFFPLKPQEREDPRSQPQVSYFLQGKLWSGFDPQDKGTDEEVLTAFDKEQRDPSIAICGWPDLHEWLLQHGKTLSEINGEEQPLTLVCRPPITFLVGTNARIARSAPEAATDRLRYLIQQSVRIGTPQNTTTTHRFLKSIIRDETRLQPDVLTLDPESPFPDRGERALELVADGAVLATPIPESVLEHLATSAIVPFLAYPDLYYPFTVIVANKEMPLLWKQALREGIQAAILALNLAPFRPWAPPNDVGDTNTHAILERGTFLAQSGLGIPGTLDDHTAPEGRREYEDDRNRTWWSQLQRLSHEAVYSYDFALAQPWLNLWWEAPTLRPKRGDAWWRFGVRGAVETSLLRASLNTADLLIAVPFAAGLLPDEVEELKTDIESARHSVALVNIHRYLFTRRARTTNAICTPTASVPCFDVLNCSCPANDDGSSLPADDIPHLRYRNHLVKRCIDRLGQAPLLTNDIKSSIADWARQLEKSEDDAVTVGCGFLLPLRALSKSLGSAKESNNDICAVRPEFEKRPCYDVSKRRSSFPQFSDQIAALTVPYARFSGGEADSVCIDNATLKDLLDATRSDSGVPLEQCLTLILSDSEVLLYVSTLGLSRSGEIKPSTGSVSGAVRRLREKGISTDGVRASEHPCEPCPRLENWGSRGVKGPIAGVVLRFPRGALTEP